ncbi:periostin-like isoform X3 [Strongylocentrotus purpuratus]|uniref:FAS1 domain-containing protein n=1 Tax=Strongylocentrotus purpuratus TaxID=7668 RepID=A0A7M7HG91_STRPU|nr:periostin-like isoform X3 [Strongylocentrotus purpuratus]
MMLRFVSIGLWLVALGWTCSGQPDPCDVPLVTDSGHKDNFTVVDLARELYACTMIKMIERAGLGPMFREKGPFTLFAPYDLAFGFLPDDIWNKLMSNNTYLRELLLFHTVPRLIGSIDNVYNDELIETMLPGKNIRLNVYQIGKMMVGGRGAADQAMGVTGRITACGGPVIDGGNATNGEVRIISNVMHPVPPGDIMDVIDNDKQFTELKKLVYLAKLQDYLKAGGPFTFFPPNNNGVDKLSRDELKKLEHNTTLLREVLLYHLLDWTLYASGSYDGEVLVTVQGESINLTVWYDSLWVNGHTNARVVYQDYNIYNGVLHIIDKVLIPPIIWQKYN